LVSILDVLLANLPPDAAVSDVCIGLRWVMVSLVDGRCGMASTLPFEHDHPHAHVWVEQAGSLHTLSAHALAGLARSEVGPEVSVGWAALNALVMPTNGADWIDLNARDLLMERGKDHCVALVGHFPFVGKLRATLDSFHVLELEPGPDDLPANAAPEIIPQADVVALSSLTLVNGTFDKLAALWRSDAFIVLIGPSTPLTPVLFDAGVDVLAGTLVVDADAVRHFVSQAASYQQITGTRRVAMATSGMLDNASV
jgi:uncharacterized protein (DUF4213/DUF364 family)